MVRVYDHEYRYDEDRFHRSDFFVKAIAMEVHSCLACKKPIPLRMVHHSCVLCFGRLHTFCPQLLCPCAESAPSSLKPPPLPLNGWHPPVDEKSILMPR